MTSNNLNDSNDNRIDDIDKIKMLTGSQRVDDELDSSSVNIEDIDNLKELTDKKVLEVAGGDFISHVVDEVTDIQEQKKKAGTYYQNLIFALVQIRLPEDEAKNDWNEILSHKYTMSEALKRNVGIHVATLDYYTNIKRKLFSPKIIDAHEYANTASKAITDELTRAYNRRAFDDEFKQLFSQSKKTGSVFSLIMLDLDDFKKYNDLNGHLRGDIALIELVKILHSVCSSSGFVARYGGEEFVVLLPGMNLKNSTKMAENIRHAVYDYRFVDEELLPNGRLTVSIGLTSYRKDMTKPSHMLEEADVAMYRAKNNGKNQVKIFLKEENESANN